MWLPGSVAGLVLCALYLLYAAACVVSDLRRGPSPLILPDATMLAAFPGLVPVLLVAELLGVSELPEDKRLRLLVYVPAVLLTAALIYLLCAAAERLLAALFGTGGRGGLR